MTVKQLEDNMQRTLEQKCYHRHRGQSMHYRYIPLNLSATSEEETSSIQNPQSPSAYMTLSHTYVPKRDISSRWCSGYSQYNKKKQPKSLLLANMKKTSGQRVQKLCESLEVQLTDMQLEEALADDKLAALVQHLDLATSALEAMLLHVQCLHVFHVSAFRVLDISHPLVLAHNSMDNYCTNCTDLTAQLQEVENGKTDRLAMLQKLMEHCSKYIVISTKLCTLMENHREKKKDFFFAAKNFKNFLDSSKLSISQIEKLYQQYNDILNEYQQSRNILDVELPKIINVRLEALCQTFQKIAEFYTNIDYIKQITALFQTIGDNLCQYLQANEEKILKKSSQNLQLCQKCKANCLDDK